MEPAPLFSTDSRLSSSAWSLAVSRPRCAVDFRCAESLLRHPAAMVVGSDAVRARPGWGAISTMCTDCSAATE
jgi:hypothetical protein